MPTLQAQQGHALPPFNALQLLLWWMPKRWRARVPHQACLRLWLPPVDGYSCKRGPQRCRTLVPTGPAELSYLLFLLTLYPLIGLMATVLLFLRIPAGVVFFVSSGHKLWVAGDTRFGRGGSKHKGQRHTRESRSLDLGAPSQSIDWGAPRFSGVGSASQAQAARMRALASIRKRMQQVAPEDLPWQQRVLRSAGRDTCAALQGANKCLTWVTAAVTAVILQLVLVVLLLLVLAYSLLAQIVWTVWCILFWWTLPQGMVTNEAPLIKRAADYWSAADLESTFQQHRVLHRHSMSRSISETNSGQATPRGMPAAAGTNSTRWSAPGVAEGSATALPGSVSRRRSYAGPGAVSGGPGATSLHRVSGGPQLVTAPVYVQCQSLAEPARSSSLQQPSLATAAGSGETLINADPDGLSTSVGTQRSNALPATPLVNHLSSILYSTDPPAPPAPGPGTIGSPQSSTSASRETSSPQSPYGPVMRLSGPSIGPSAAMRILESSPAAGHTPPGTAAAQDTASAAAAVSIGAASSQSPLWPSVEAEVPCDPPGGSFVPTSMRPASSAARSLATLPGAL
jgi:hypothetical protein